MKSYYLIPLLFLFSCVLTKQQRTDNKVVRKMEKLAQRYPKSFEAATTATMRIDTLIKKVEIEGKTVFDTLEVEKLVKEYIKDTVEVPRFITRFLHATRDTIHIDSVGVHLRIAGSNINYSLKRDSIYISKQQKFKTITVTNTEVVKVVWWKDPFFWILIILLALAILYKIGKLRIPRF